MKRLTPHQLKSHSPRECAEWKRRVECRINVVWMPENDAIQIRLAVQLTGHECRPKRNFDRLTSGMSQQTGSCHGQITKAIFWDIRDCQCDVSGGSPKVMSIHPSLASERWRIFKAREAA
jgi:hypothetical protein